MEGKTLGYVPLQNGNYKILDIFRKKDHFHEYRE